MLIVNHEGFQGENHGLPRNEPYFETRPDMFLCLGKFIGTHYDVCSEPPMTKLPQWSFYFSLGWVKSESKLVANIPFRSFSLMFIEELRLNTLSYWQWAVCDSMCIYLYFRD